ncbi:phosphoethanolamine transferase [Alysiella crassa]|uniref:Phosphoethanolamine transferase ybiP n=1 Tax=Alysiella crassa TaxID=153491 RepID=A0A376BN32_9NEIS|nr:phosphoethanolamine transferase [Alysiella crassa]UOP06711.1 phosphoethanolamine transferase [Alysiella crassa]SSY71182.1 Putative phosphoethanolamine transferase ybiP [Alysiella crassa]
MMKLIQKWQIQLIFLLIFCFCTYFATGYGFHYRDTLTDKFWGIFGTFCLLLAWASVSPRGASVAFKIFLFTTMIYFPVAWLYGAPSFKLMGGALEADMAEVGEFVHFVPKYVWLLQAAYTIFALFLWRILPPNVFVQARHWAIKWRVALAGFALLALLSPILGNNHKNNMINQYDKKITPVVLVGFYADLFAAPHAYWQQKNQLLQQATQPAHWQIQAVEPKYKNHILVVGESARKDYLHAYGFPLENTPFLSKSKGLLIDGYISTAEFTMLSLPKTLSLSQQSHHNIVSLAKQAGFQTAWLSNQGMLGVFANEVSSYAKRSDVVFFAPRHDGQPAPDSALLPELEKVLLKQSDKPRLIVLHIMGSHHDFCQRLDNGVQFDYQSKNLSCYASTIKETDDLLRNVVEILKKQGESYSLVYFSDHGLKHTGVGTPELTLRHGGDTYQSFEVPLAKISSDDTEHKIIKTQRTAFNFLKGFAQWTGIRTPELHENGYDFWGEQADLPNQNNNLQQVNQMKQDGLIQD